MQKCRALITPYDKYNASRKEISLGQHNSNLILLHLGFRMKKR